MSEKKLPEESKKIPESEQQSTTFRDKIRSKGGDISTELDNESDKNEDEVKSLKESLEKALSDNESLLRALAEKENTLRRVNDEAQKSIKYALSNFIKDTVIVMDHFYLSVSSVDSETLENNSFKHFYDAINLTLNEVTKLFEKYQVKRIHPENQKFDPQMHEAVSQLKVEGQESGIVTKVLSSGYILEDRVLKPAIVIVSA